MSVPCSIRLLTIWNKAITVKESSSVKNGAEAEKGENMVNRILVIGAGVLGCNLAANLHKSGKDVTLLARGQWYEEIKKNGLRIKKQLSIGTRVYRIPVIDRLLPDDRYDVIFVSLRYTELDTVMDVLNSNCTQNIIFNGNNPRAEETARRLPDKDVMFCFSQSAGHRERTRVCSVNMNKITVGDIGNADNETFIRDIFTGTRYSVTYQPNMGDYLLCHLGFVLPACFACYYTDGNLKKIKNDKEYISKIIRANIECYEAIERTGHEILPESDQDYKSRKYFDSCLKFYKLMCATFLGKLCVSDHAMNAVDEMRILAGDMENVLRKSGIPYPVYAELKTAMDKY